MKRNYLLVILAAALVLLQSCSNRPKSYGESIDLSLALYNSQQYQKSIEAAQEALKLEPNSAVAYNNICAAYNQLQQWDKAIPACQKALAIDPNSALARNNLAAAQAAGISLIDDPIPTKSYEEYLNDSLALYNAGEYQKVVAAAQAALRLQPDSAIAYNNICAAYNQLTQWDQAITACQKALAIAPSFELAKNNLGAALKARPLELPATPVASSQSAVTPNAGDPWTAAINESLTYYQAGDYQKSLEAAQKALATKPDSALAHNNICAAYNQLKHWDRAIEACQRALTIDPNFELAKNNLRAAQERKSQ
jgi:tetratricopeptide (TPR) repeat protein